MKNVSLLIILSLCFCGGCSKPLQIDLTGPKSSVLAGTPVSLTCTIFNAGPETRILWYRTRNQHDVTPIDHSADLRNLEILEEFKEKPNGIFITMGTLTFTATAREGSNKFTCQSTEEPNLEKSVLLLVNYPPAIRVFPTYDVKPGEPLIIDCNYFANPRTLTNVKWFKNGIEQRGNEANVNEFKNSTFYRQHAKKEDEGEYKCLLKNEIGETLSQAIKVSIS